MNDSKKTGITEETLEQVLRRLNSSFVKSLPAEPKQILRFAKRRTDPIISNNINPELAEKMRSHRLSDEDYLITLFTAIRYVFDGKEKVQNPQASILMAQTGAGKTNLRTMILQQNPNTVTINSDQYKKFRPDEKIILAEDPTHFGALTGIDSYDHSSNITEFAKESGYNLLIECAPSMQQGMIGVDLETLKGADYDTQIHVMAVGNLVSALAIHLRYENELKKGIPSGDVKLTDLKRHNESYLAVEKMVKELDDGILSIYRRGTAIEGQIPHRITNTSMTPLEILRQERDKSNNEYIESQNFGLDHQSILVSMKQRTAPEAQRQQLESIYKMYKSYIDRIR